MLHHPIFLKENPCRTWITNPHLGTAGTDKDLKVPNQCKTHNFQPQNRNQNFYMA